MSKTLCSHPMRRGLPYFVLFAGSLAWIALVFLAPWARQQGLSWGGLLHACYAPICHQLPQRSFHLWSFPLAVCHRCLGLYVGFAFGLAVLPFWQRFQELLLKQPRLLLAFFVPMGIDVMLLSRNVPISRFTTGLIAAFPVGLFVWTALEQLSAKSQKLSDTESSDTETTKE